MDHILRAAYFDHICNVCGGHYRVTLYELMRELEVAGGVASARPHEACHADFDSYLATIPLEPLVAIDRAWTELTRQLTPSNPLQVKRAQDIEG
ncbi:MAG: hypothetical protein R3C29_00755 [Dehalococcoidia bacterium]